MYARTPARDGAGEAVSATSIPPRPGSAPSGAATGNCTPFAARKKLAAQVSSGTAGTTCWSIWTLSLLLPSAERTATVQRSWSIPSGTVTGQVTGTARPAGTSTVTGSSRATPGASSAVATIFIALSVLLRRVNTASKASPVRTNGGTPE